ncbi:LysR family transcriptional regulator [Sorangium sp. So ce1182]|uniref:LysR family transcriptional regulator n=1 Tax=Sorangium sp. So ce1182 TaxID=3133334 RepID=UPI003F63E47B
MLPDLNEIAVFTRVVQAGSFTRAARELGMPKSTVSRKVSELEARLGAQLLRRTTRKLSLTDVGTAYYERCARIVAELDDADRTVTQMQEGPRGLLRVTAPLHFGWVGGVVAEYLRVHPEVSVEVVCTDRVVDLVAEGFDVALRFGAPSDTSLVARRLGALPRYLVAAPAYLARRGAPRAPADLAGHDVVASAGARAGEPPGARWVLHRGARRAEVRVAPRATANNLEVLHRVVLAGVGIGMLPAMRCEQDVREGRLARVLDEWSPVEVPLHVVYPGTRHLSPKVKVFLDLVRERIAPALRERREARAGPGRSGA